MANCAACDAPLEVGARFCPACGAPVGAPLWEGAGQETQAMPDPAGRRLAPGLVFAGRYEIEAEIGEGGMGAVYRARDRVSGDLIALKVIRADRSWSQAAMQQLVREGAVARRIRHPSVVSVYDVSEVDGAPFISMELLQGQSLRAWSRQRIAAGRDCPFATAAQVMVGISDGLIAAHALGIVHRDLKPENVFLLGDPDAGAPQLKILDFGLARLSTANIGSTGTSSAGTPLYMAPEQRTSPEAVTVAADIYSLSVMFYELLVDVTPHGVWQPPSSGRADVPAAIDTLILEGVSGRPRGRPQSVAEYRARILAAMTMGATSPGGVAGPSKTAKTRVQTPAPDRAIPSSSDSIEIVGKAPASLRTSSWRQLFLPNGRIGRGAFAFRAIAIALAVWTLEVVVNTPGPLHDAILLAGKVGAVALVLAGVVAAALRFHDLRLSGWFAVAVAAASIAGLLLVPWLGFAIAGVCGVGLAVAKGDPLQNRYGSTTTP